MNRIDSARAKLSELGSAIAQVADELDDHEANPAYVVEAISQIHNGLDSIDTALDLLANRNA
jgi:hypothetical protein